MRRIQSQAASHATSEARVASKGHAASQHFCWSSDGYRRPQEALSAWLALFSAHFHEIQSDALSDNHPFRLRQEQHTLGSVRVNFVATQWSRIKRTRSLIANSGRRDFVLFQARSGGASFRLPQGARAVGPGECILVNTGEPYEMECAQPTRGVSLTFPGHWFSRWVPRPERCPSFFDTGGAWSGALCKVVGALEPESIQHLALPAAAVAENIMGLIALAAGPEHQELSPSLRESLLATLHESFQDPALSPQRLARQHDISLRTLHYAFASAGTSFSQELMRVRLEYARELLTDVRLSRLGIADIAARCGFADQSHFTRRFQRHFGAPPLRFRKLHARGGVISS